MRKVTADEYAHALEKIGRPSENVMAALRAHCQAPGRALTATKLAILVDYKTHGGINLGYGLYAGKLGRGLKPKITNQRPLLSLMVDLVRPTTVTNRDFVLVVRPDFAEALERLHWI